MSSTTPEAIAGARVLGEMFARTHGEVKRIMKETTAIVRDKAVDDRRLQVTGIVNLVLGRVTMFTSEMKRAIDRGTVLEEAKNNELSVSLSSTPNEKFGRVMVHQDALRNEINAELVRFGVAIVISDQIYHDEYQTDDGVLMYCTWTIVPLAPRAPL